MRSDTIHVTNAGAGMAEALAQAEAVAAYKRLSAKNTVRLRLLTEEMLGMLRGIAGQTEADFRIEDDQGDFSLILTAKMRMTGAKREKLLSVSSSGTNAAAKGVTGRIRNLFEQALEPIDDNTPERVGAGWCISPVGAATLPDAGMLEAEMWSLNQYRAVLQTKKPDSEEWDELEKSVVANLADDVQIAIRGTTVEMIIRKKFA